MAKKRPDIPHPVKQRLIDGAGGKCANPGCASVRTHIHHIKEWAVYETHDTNHMIAICPTCHDAVHHGPLEIDDETVYRWKHVARSRVQRDHVYVEPSESSKLLLGSIYFTGKGGVTVFDLGESSRLSFRVIDGDVMLLNLAVCTTAGVELLRIVDGHVIHEAEPPVDYQRVPGRVKVTAPVTADFVPTWITPILREPRTAAGAFDPEFGADGRYTVLDIEVLEPGLVRVQGLWSAPGCAVAITREALAFLDISRDWPFAMAGGGTILFTGPLTTSLFGFGRLRKAVALPGALRYASDVSLVHLHGRS
jgi:hypothetical protein